MCRLRPISEQPLSLLKSLEISLFTAVEVMSTIPSWVVNIVVYHIVVAQHISCNAKSH
jgi:hypothetical protein